MKQEIGQVPNVECVPYA